jgi:translation initiation factor 4A
MSEQRRSDRYSDKFNGNEYKNVRSQGEGTSNYERPRRRNYDDERRNGNGDRQYGGNGGNGDNRRRNGRNDYHHRNEYRKSSDEQYENRQKEQEQEQNIDNEEPEQIKTSKYELTEEELALREKAMIPIETFDDLSDYIDLKIIRGVMAYGFENPSPIQKKAIKPFLSKYDLIAQAQSGTGKTATFCIGTLGNIDFERNDIQAIVIAHTMELAQQIEHVFMNIGKYVDVRIGMAVKSVPVRDNIDNLLGRTTEGKLPHVVIGTPGRILDMINKRVIDMETVRVLVLDEADELLSEGFAGQIRQIVSQIGGSTQIGLFSATMNDSFFKITSNFMRNPINILIEKENLTLDGIKQYNVNCEKNDYKFDTLCDLYSLFSTSQTIIYCNNQQSVEMLTKKMQDQQFKVSFIHGGMNIQQREETMKNFRSLQTRVLISTDLLGRGIDVQQVSIVINYDIPFKNEAYIHRIGRSGRHGRTGTAVNLVTNNDIRKISDIEKYYSIKIPDLPSDVSKIFTTNN